MEFEYDRKLPCNSIGLLWKQMARGETITKQVIRPVIRDSWDRSRSYGVEPMNPHLNVIAPEQISPGRDIKSLLQIAKPYVKELYQTVSGSGFAITLCDENGWVLDLIGDSDVIRKAEDITMVPGANWSEEFKGSSGMGICLAIQEPIQITGPEHYLQICHSWTCSAAPLFGADKRLIGVLNMSADFRKLHPHTFGMVVAAAQAITHQVQARHSRYFHFATSNFVQTIFDLCSDGLVSVDSRGIVQNLNETAMAILPNSVNRGQPLPPETSGCLGIDEVLAEGQPLLQRKTDIYSSDGRARVHVLASVKPIIDGDTVIGAIAKVNHADQTSGVLGQEFGIRFRFSDILGVSPAIREAVDLAKKAAQHDANILIVGESGTGKEMFAQAIHSASKRRHQPFVAINCSAIPRELFASEFFGYNEGAFTGARRSGAIGKFELADQGSLFLDEVGDMPLEQQPGLLRVLEEKRITRIGGTHPKQVNVRVISATNHDLTRKIAEGTFRCDLYYRLNVLCIKVPALRERPEDITLLTNHFLVECSRDFGVRVDVSEEALQALKRYHWPGNVRELKNVIQQAVFLAKGGEISERHLHLLPKAAGNSQPESLVLKDVEREYIMKAMAKAHGNMERAAALLGISKTTLYRRLKEVKSQF